MSTNSDPIFAEERKQKILDIVEKKKKVTVLELSDLLNVSGTTVRTYLKELEQLKLLRRTHGGAILDSKASHELVPEDKKIKFLDEKIAIARKALTYIDDGDTIILDTSTTNLQLANILDEKKNLTILTNDMVIANRLEEYNEFNVILIGGILKKRFHCTTGTLGLKMIQNMVIDKAFMATNALSVQKGASTPDVSLAEIKKGMISISDRVIMLCDSSKIGKNSFMNFAAFDDFDTLITDKNIPDEAKEQFELIGLDVIIAD
jgi:DeoR family fructose operon transcriptional repressor